MSTHLNRYHGPYHNSPGQTPFPYWKRAHQSWISWVGMVLIVASGRKRFIKRRRYIDNRGQDNSEIRDQKWSDLQWMHKRL